VLAGTALLVILSRDVQRGNLFWIPLAVVLGPLGFLVWLIVGRSRKTSPWQAILLEAAGDVMPTAVAFAAYLALALSLPAVMGSELAQLALILGLPLALGWLAFQGPLLALAANTGYLRTLWEQLPHVLVAANLGMAGVNAVAVPLLNVSLRTCAVFPSPGWTVGVLWAIVVLGALLGGLLLALYQWWAAKRDLSAWRALASRDGAVRSASWGTLWWWIPLSYLALVGGVVAGVVLSQLLST
jgi:hypothetical protein